MIEVRNLRKEFKLYPRPADRLKEIVLRRPFHTRYPALRDISFRVSDGETLGILGRNGAGKSTLLKILNGVLLPDGGEVDISGRVTGLLELGTGFDSTMSGRHNILTNGLLLGMSEAEIRARENDIISFSELGRFIDEPLRTYSSGMVMRLAFSIAIHADPEIFLIDEALSVGDGHFQQKCLRRIRQFRAEGGSIIFVSHDLNAVKMICDRALVLSDGLVVAEDEPEAAANHYNQLLGADEDLAEPPPERENTGYGSFEATIAAVEAIGADSMVPVVTSGEDMLLSVDIVARDSLPSVTLGLMIRDRFGQDIYGTNTHHLDRPIALEAGRRYRYRFRIPMLLAPGKYTVTVALHEGIDHTRHCYHWWDNAAVFEIAGIRGPVFGGVCNLRPVLEDCITDPSEALTEATWDEQRGTVSAR